MESPRISGRRKKLFCQMLGRSYTPSIDLIRAGYVLKTPSATCAYMACASSLGASRSASLKTVEAAPRSVMAFVWCSDLLVIVFVRQYPECPFSSREKNGPPTLVNCLPFLGQGNRSPRDGRLSVHRPEIEARSVDQGARGRDVREGLGYRSVAKVLGVPAEAVRDWLGEVPSDREGRAPRHGWKAGKIRLRDQGRRGQRRGRRRDGQARSDGALRHRERDVAEAVVQAVPRGRRRRAPAQAEGQAEGARARRPRRRPASRSSNARSAGSRRRWRT